MKNLGSGILQIMQQNIFMANKLNFSTFDCAGRSISYWEILVDHRKTCKRSVQKGLYLGEAYNGHKQKKKALREQQAQPSSVGAQSSQAKSSVLPHIALNYSLQSLLACFCLVLISIFINCLLWQEFLTTNYWGYHGVSYYGGITVKPNSM